MDKFINGYVLAVIEIFQLALVVYEAPCDYRFPFEARLVATVEASQRCICGLPNQMEITHPMAASPR
jgi:hypothetical protein